MAGFTKIYCIGGLGGYMGADGINPMLVQIWQGDADKQWFEPHYFQNDLKPIGNVRKIIPAAPYQEDNLLDACIAFCAAAFEHCPSMPGVTKALGDTNMINFFRDGEPQGWGQLREEARSAFKKLNIWTAELERV
jgi:hypothetical protein